jgi:hypothetical protein
MMAIWSGLIWQTWRKQGSMATADAIVLAFAVLLFFSPVINAWYLLWLLPLTTQTRWVTPWLAALVLPFSYATHFNIGTSSVPYTLPDWVIVLEWVTVLGALLVDFRRIAKLRHADPIPTI